MLFEKFPKHKGLAQVEAWLPSKHEALSSNPTKITPYLQGFPDKTHETFTEVIITLIQTLPET
jgi:hypothetical protein